jgi:hypothetical protein
MASQHDYHIAAEKDVSGKANRHILYYFVALGLMLFLMIYGLDVMYRFMVDGEKKEKIGEVFTHESIVEVARSESYLSGKQGLFEGKRHVPIADAMARFLSDIRQAR